MGLDVHGSGALAEKHCQCADYATVTRGLFQLGAACGGTTQIRPTRASGRPGLAAGSDLCASRCQLLQARRGEGARALVDALVHPPVGGTDRCCPNPSDPRRAAIEDKARERTPRSVAQSRCVGALPETSHLRETPPAAADVRIHFQTKMSQGSPSRVAAAGAGSGLGGTGAGVLSNAAFPSS